MSRFLLVVPPLTGHVNPLASVAAELGDRGHAVAWVGSSGAIADLVPEGQHVFDAPGHELFASFNPQTLGRLDVVREAFLRVAVPLATSMLPAVENAIDAFRPDLVVADQHALAGGLAARRRGLTWATSAPTAHATSPAVTGFAALTRWIDAHVADIERSAGLEPLGTRAELSRALVIAYTTPNFAGGSSYPHEFRFVGPCFRKRPERAPFPWGELGPPPRLVAIFGTIVAAHAAPVQRAVIEALAGSPVRVVMPDPAGGVDGAPENVLVRPYVPYAALLPHMDAVVTHGGYNTVSEALALGVPLVVAPMAFDQGVVAEQVVATGTGIRLRASRLTVPELREAIFEVLEEPGYRAHAREVAESFRAAGGEDAAADALEALV